MRRFYYFGCRGDRAGHFLHGGDSAHDERLDGGFPVYMLDSTFAPLDMNEPWWRLTQLRFNHNVLSILSRWDTTIDKRPNSNATFVAIDSEPWDEERILAEARVKFPDCWERLRLTGARP
jgi:hypothetical protein